MLVMVVDDSPTIRTIVTWWLQKEGYDVVPCKDGIQALAWMTRQQCIPDLMLLDVCLPKLDGFAVAQRLRQQQRGCQPIIIMLSGQADVPTRERGRLLGIQGFLSKPFEVAALIEMVRRYAR